MTSPVCCFHPAALPTFIIALVKNEIGLYAGDHTNKRVESPGLKLPFDRIFVGQKFCNCEFQFPVLMGLNKSGRLKEKHLFNPLICMIPCL